MTFKHCGKHQLGIDEITERYQPKEHYRISVKTYPADTTFTGSSRKGDIYLLSGHCKFSSANDTLELSGCEFASQVKESQYTFEVLSKSEVTIVRVWPLPKEFWEKPKDLTERTKRPKQ